MESGSDRFGIGLGFVSDRFGIGSGTVWSCLDSVRAQFWMDLESTSIRRLGLALMLVWVDL